MCLLSTNSSCSRRPAWDLKGKVTDRAGKMSYYQSKVKTVDQENESLKESVAKSRRKEVQMTSELQELHTQLGPSSLQGSTLSRCQTTLRETQDTVCNLEETVTRQTGVIHCGEMDRRELHNAIQELKARQVGHTVG
ncbi:unnamed protein product [Oncorhynchus mykiss]|uniref:Uncharacterized protein n=1 Tax=Oncorhynchus mykiss TaxID=8022 RepID=A0A060VR40_ONCMY|nr:unnamed protein product [Oncorhynchus mykiss]